MIFRLLANAFLCIAYAFFCWCSHFVCVFVRVWVSFDRYSLAAEQLVVSLVNLLLLFSESTCDMQYAAVSGMVCFCQQVLSFLMMTSSGPQQYCLLC